MDLCSLFYDILCFGVKRSGNCFVIFAIHFTLDCGFKSHTKCIGRIPAGGCDPAEKNVLRRGMRGLFYQY